MFMDIAVQPEATLNILPFKAFKTRLPIPAPAKSLFTGGTIQHAELWLWDSWVVEIDGETHLYCLAIPKYDDRGLPISPKNRDEYYFHIRRFKTSDFGQTWQDMGAVLTSGQLDDESDAGNVWSGSVFQLKDGQILHGYTGIAANSLDHQYHQSICYAVGDETGPSKFPTRAFSDPVRDRQEITNLGYYLGPADVIGHNDGEEGGPLTAWRDPLTFEDDDGQIYSFWSAKISPTVPAVAYAKLDWDGEDMSFQLMPPITLPDDHDYTQAEVPKIMKDFKSGTYYLMISTVNRIHEKQPDSEISKELRLYKSQSLTGPWQPYREEGPKIPNVEHLFGASFMGADFDKGEIYIIAPYTELGDPSLQLSFAPVQTITL